MPNEKHQKHNEKLVAFVDVDETICFYDDTSNRVYELAVPNFDNIGKINKLHNEGWIIIYWTARGSTQPQNKIRLDYLRDLTVEQLNTWGAKFHKIEMGDKKPLYDLIIDDKAKRIEEL